MTQLRRVAIVGGNRIPFARSNTVYATASNQEMLTSALEGLVERYNLHGERLGEVVAGAVLKHSRDFNLTRECVLGSRLAPETPAYDIQQACGTGLEAAILVANKIALRADRQRHRRRRRYHFRRADRGQRGPAQDSPRGQPRQEQPGQAQEPAEDPPAPRGPGHPAQRRAAHRAVDGESCELMAQTWQIPRDEQDRLAFESHHKLAAAYEEGWQNDLMTPFRGLTRDQNLRPDIDLEKIGTLKPVFERGSRGTLTAANSTPLTDGASVVLLASEEWAKARGLPILAYFKDGEAAAVNFVDRQEGLLMAPVYAVPRLLARNGLSLQDFDYYEIHEAFAAQVLCTLKAWEDPEYCKTRLGLDQPLGSIDRSKPQRQGQLAGRRPPVRRHGRTDRRQPGQLLSLAEQDAG